MTVAHGDYTKIFQVSKHALDINLIKNNDDDNNKIHDNDIGSLP